MPTFASGSEHFYRGAAFARLTLAQGRPPPSSRPYPILTNIPSYQFRHADHSAAVGELNRGAGARQAAAAAGRHGPVRAAAAAPRSTSALCDDDSTRTRPPPPPGASPSPPPTSRRRHCAGRAAVAEPFVTGDDVDMKAPISRGGVTGGRPSPRSTSPQLPRAKTPPRSDAPDRPKSRQRTGPGPGIAPAHGGGPDEGSVDGVADVTVSVGAPSCRGSAT